MMLTQNGKLLYISDNAAEYLGHSMVSFIKVVHVSYLIPCIYHSRGLNRRQLEMIYPRSLNRVTAIVYYDVVYVQMKII